MKIINEGIVFSNDIFRILNGKNALDFNYENKGIKIPTIEQINRIRKDFKKDVERIFKNNVTIFSETEMDNFLYTSINDCEEYPHCVIR